MRTYMRGIWTVFLILIFIVILFGGVIYLSRGSQSEKNVIETIKEFFEEIGNKDTPQDNSDDGSGGGSIGGGEGDSGGGGGGGGDSVSSSEGETCEKTTISYSIIDISKTQICIGNQTEICTEKNITCYSVIQNRDSEIGGFFEIQLFFVEERKDISEAIEIETSRFFLDPFQKETFQKTIVIQSLGEDGLANQNINCFFNTIEVPTKCI